MANLLKKPPSLCLETLSPNESLAFTVLVQTDFDFLSSPLPLLDRIVKLHILQHKFSYVELSAVGNSSLSTLLPPSHLHIANFLTNLAVNGVQITRPTQLHYSLPLWSDLNPNQNQEDVERRPHRHLLPPPLARNRPPRRSLQPRRPVPRRHLLRDPRLHRRRRRHQLPPPPRGCLLPHCILRQLPYPLLPGQPPLSIRD